MRIMVYSLLKGTAGFISSTVGSQVGHFMTSEAGMGGAEVEDAFRDHGKF